MANGVCLAAADVAEPESAPSPTRRRKVARNLELKDEYRMKLTEQLMATSRLNTFPVIVNRCRFYATAVVILLDNHQ